VVLKLKIFVFPPPRAPVTPPPPRDRPRESQIDYRKSSPAALRSCGAERVFAPPAAKKEKRLKNSPFCPKKKTEGDVLFTCPEPGAERGAAGRQGGARGRKDEEPAFWGTSIPLYLEGNCTVSYPYCTLYAVSMLYDTVP
jgi:hypothetical protein